MLLISPLGEIWVLNRDLFSTKCMASFWGKNLGLLGIGGTRDSACVRQRVMGVFVPGVIDRAAQGEGALGVGIPQS